MAMIAPLDKRSINLFDALNANSGSKINFQELASSNEHICSVEGHVIAIEAKAHTKAMFFLVIDASELLSLDTKDIAGGPDPIHQVQPSQLHGPITRLFIIAARTLEPYIPKFGSGNDFV